MPRQASSWPRRKLPHQLRSRRDGTVHLFQVPAGFLFCYCNRTTLARQSALPNAPRRNYVRQRPRASPDHCDDYRPGAVGGSDRRHRTTGRRGDVAVRPALRRARGDRGLISERHPRSRRAGEGVDARPRPTRTGRHRLSIHRSVRHGPDVFGARGNSRRPRLECVLRPRSSGTMARRTVEWVMSHTPTIR
jgi:hypothetical protein